MYAEWVFKCPVPTVTTSPPRWSPPEVGWVKINFDANVIDDVERGLGVVVCNSDGVLLVTGVRRVWANWDAELSELLAAAFGVELARRLGFSHIVLEGDCAVVISGIRRCPSGFTPFFLILDYIQSLIPSFCGFNCTLIRRQCNTVAHSMARWNSGNRGEVIFMDPLPSSLVSLAFSDIV